MSYISTNTLIADDTCSANFSAPKDRLLNVSFSPSAVNPDISANKMTASTNLRTGASGKIPCL